MSLARDIALIKKMSGGNGSGGGDGTSISVDSTLSATSTNPVQNKIVTAALANRLQAPATAAVGQTIRVSAVDGAGKPTAWEAVDLPSGGGGEEWELITTITISADDQLARIRQSLNGSYKKIFLKASFGETTPLSADSIWRLLINGDPNAFGAARISANQAYTDYAFRAEIIDHHYISGVATAYGWYMSDAWGSSNVLNGDFTAIENISFVAESGYFNSATWTVYGVRE